MAKKRRVQFPSRCIFLEILLSDNEVALPACVCIYEASLLLILLSILGSN